MSEVEIGLEEQVRARVLATGGRVLQTEGQALLLLSNSLTENFVRAVDLIYRSNGRVIMSGMGKSGHVARKIAATLASTGTPAHFVHPAEASHGDLGMITQGDVCIGLSNSGETSELSDVIAHTRRFSIPLIGVASRAGSTLLKVADIAILLPNAPEACAIGMAPTTSTTMAMALGDALAVAVMELRGFKPENFRTFHPGGKLGAQLMRVGQLMHTAEALPLIKEEAPMSDALLVMTQKSFGVVGTVDNDGALVGVISDGDLRRNMEGLMSKSAREVATKVPKTIEQNALAAEALALMHSKSIQCLFVVDEQRVPVGLIHIHDCLRAGVQ